MNHSAPDKNQLALGSHPARSATQAAGPFTAIAQMPFFTGAAESALAHLSAKARVRICAPGEVIVDSGDETDEVYFLLSGAVRVMVRTTFGHEAILNDLGPGSFFGELSAIDDQPRSANVTALLHTRLCVLPGATFMEIVLSSPDLTHRLLCLLSTRLRAKDERLIEFSVMTVRQRLIAELLRLSRDRGDGKRVLSPPPPQRVLAARIGTRRESVSRELVEMSRSGLLTVGRRAILVLKPDVLLAEVQATR